MRISGISRTVAAMLGSSEGMPQIGPVVRCNTWMLALGPGQNNRRVEPLLLVSPNASDRYDVSVGKRVTAATLDSPMMSLVFNPL